MQPTYQFAVNSLVVRLFDAILRQLIESKALKGAAVQGNNLVENGGAKWNVCSVIKE